MNLLNKLVKSVFLFSFGLVLLFIVGCEGTTFDPSPKFELSTPENVRVQVEKEGCYVFFGAVENADSYFIYVYKENNQTESITTNSTVVKKLFVTSDDGILGYFVTLDNGNYGISVEATNSKDFKKSDKSDIILVEINNVLTPATYTINYVLNGGKLDATASYSYEAGTAYELPIPVKTGYEFVGWYSNSTFTSNKIDKILSTDKGNKTFYANFKKEGTTTSTITYNLNGGNLPNDAVYSYEEGTTVILAIPTKSGYSFEGWYTNSSFTGSKVTTITNTMTGNLTYYAKWKVISTSSLEPYYSDAANLTGSGLKKALRTIISTGISATTYDNLKTKLGYTDADPNNPNNILLLFSHASVKGTWDGAVTWNREHVWPQSKGWFKTSGAGADIQHIRPEDPTVNSIHGNLPYGEVPNGKVVTYKGATVAHYTSSYFEPLDEFKGDIARIIFYLLVRYAESDSYNITAVAQSMEMLLRWHEADPVDDFEILRNERSYSVQKNRNPFIDHPEFASMIWK